MIQAACSRPLRCSGTSGVTPIQGVTQGHHDLSHHGKDPEKLSDALAEAERLILAALC